MQYKSYTGTLQIVVIIIIIIISSSSSSSSSYIADIDVEETCSVGWQNKCLKNLSHKRRTKAVT
jgi:hypothetical protein